MRFSGLVLFLVLTAANFYSSAQTGQKKSREEYKLAFKEIAIAEMKRSGIPASISLAQGMIESDNGNSSLARQANNHFGIKCHDWSGEKIYHDDDDNNECFRKYESADESYKDHTDFLMNGSRYVFLFYLDQTDYKGWARGLEKAGYATDRTYANDLIRIIEENELFAYDKPLRKKKKREMPEEEKLADSGTVKAGLAEAEETVTGSGEAATAQGTQRKILTLNRINYITVIKGDTYLGVSEEFKLLPFELARYNEIEKNAPLDSGQVLFIQPKRNKASVEYKFHTVAEGETMYQISQHYGIKLQKLYEKNLMKEGTEPSPGDVLSLRKTKTGEVPAAEEVPEEKGPVIEFE
jgi:LysM repeat protein